MKILGEMTSTKESNGGTLAASTNHVVGPSLSAGLILGIAKFNSILLLNVEAE